MYILFLTNRSWYANCLFETCTGRMRYLGVLLYDADRVQEAASAKDEKDLYEKQLDLFLDPLRKSLHKLKRWNKSRMDYSSSKTHQCINWQ